MALIAKTAPSFESIDDEIASPAATSSTAVAVAAPATGIQASFAAATDTIGNLKNAMRVTYDMLIPLVATNGNLVKRADKKAVGDEVIFDLLSWQDSWTITPGSDQAPKDMVKYSDDGVLCSDGTPVAEHLQQLRNLGYSKAKANQRLVVVGSVVSCSKTKDLDDELVQIDLAPQSRTAFMNYAISAMNKQRLGKATPEQVTKMKATAELATMGSNTFTRVAFSAA